MCSSNPGVCCAKYENCGVCMNNCNKHRYKYAFSSKLTVHDIKLLKLGYFKSSKKNNRVGDSRSFYECVNCGDMIAMELL